MARFLINMDSVFAPFPIMPPGIGLPWIVNRLPESHAMIGAKKMLCGVCGNLVTLKAADGNRVPTVIRCLAGNVALLFLMVSSQT
jgi:uncharacterized membrane protein